MERQDEKYKHLSETHLFAPEYKTVKLFLNQAQIAEYVGNDKLEANKEAIKNLQPIDKVEYVSSHSENGDKELVTVLKITGKNDKSMEITLRYNANGSLTEYYNSLDKK
jgi:hypothetical protein